MPSRRRKLIPLADRGPLRVMFITTSMPVGGAETLLVSLVRRMDRERFAPSLCCLKSLGTLGETLVDEIPTFHDLIHGKYDFGVALRLARRLRHERIDAVVTVGAGDKMFWGRIAARLAGVPVVCCALHSTGWPDAVTRANRLRWLTRWTDAFIAVAEPHGRHLVDFEGFPADKVHVIPNGIDVDVYRRVGQVQAAHRMLGIDPAVPLVGIVAALRPEKNHELFLQAAARVRERIPSAQFLVIGDGPERDRLEKLADELELFAAVHFLGNRTDVPELLAALNVFVLTSRMEANPVSILEAMASGKPVVAPRVGSIAESVIDSKTGFLTDPGDLDQVVDRVVELLSDRALARRMGQGGARPSPTVARSRRWSADTNACSVSCTKQRSIAGAGSHRPPPASRPSPARGCRHRTIVTRGQMDLFSARCVPKPATGY